MSDEPHDFLWRDGDRMVVFRGAALASAQSILAEQGWSSYELLSTARALGSAPAELIEGAAAVHEVGPGKVGELAGSLLESVSGDSLVSLGGGRVIDTAKALAAVRGARVCAIPTTLSGAEMTWVHRLPPGYEDRPRRRPALVLADPLAMTGQEGSELRASAMNALAHGAESLYTPLRNPVASLAALHGAALLAGGLDDPARSEPARRRLALGSILSAYALDSAMFGLHHVVCQTLAQLAGTPHAATNATMLPHTLGAMRGRAPQAMAALAGAIGAAPETLPERIAELGGGPRRLGDLVSDRSVLEEVADAAAARSELALTPDPPRRDELLAMLEAAW